ncbi:MAG: type II secretion system inner membrane protein GspF [Rhodoferax sp.]
MPEFVWRAVGADAQVQHGRQQAVSAAAVMAQLRAQRLTPLAVSEAGAGAALPATATVQNPSAQPGSVWKGWRRSAGVKPADILLWTQELSIMLKAGLALDTALRVLMGMSAKPDLAALTQAVLTDVKAGVPLSKALARHPQHFGDFYVNMVRSGEAGGQLSAVLERLYEHLERLRALRESVVSAAIYPMILLGVAVLSLVAMLGFVVPQFETLFKEMGDALPLPTQVIMAVGHVFQQYGWVLALLTVALVWALRRWLRSAAGSAWLQQRALALPLVGPLVLKYNLTLFARSLGTLLGNGVPLLAALHIASQTVGSAPLRVALESVIPKVKGGARVVDALSGTAVFEPLALNLVRVGEETGRIGPMLLEVARIFNGEVETGIKRGLTLLEPVLILVLGALIASIIVSIMLGILSVNDLAV